MKVVLDTNIIISAFLWTGVTSKILDFIEQDKITVFSCFEQILELEGVLRRPKFKKIFQKTGLNPDLVFLGFLSIASVAGKIEQIKVIKEDLDDNDILACALASQADFLISGDEHLLRLRNYQNVKIVKPAEFLEEMEKIAATKYV